jgi:hypothetical protein
METVVLISSYNGSLPMDTPAHTWDHIGNNTLIMKYSFFFLIKNKMNYTYLIGKSTSGNKDGSLVMLSLRPLLCFVQGGLVAWDDGSWFITAGSVGGEGGALTVTPGGNWWNEVSINCALFTLCVSTATSGSDSGGCKIWGSDGSAN